MKRNLFNEEHDEFRASVRSFAERTLIPRREEFSAAGSIPRDVWLDAGKLGLLGLEIPSEFGGSAANDYRFTVAANEELSAVSHAFSSAFGIHFDIVAPYLVAFGTPEQQERWLPGMARGELIAALAMTEPSGGSDLAALQTTAVREDDAWVVNGSKTFITNGHIADLAVVAVRTGGVPGAKGISLLVIETSTQGVTQGPPLDTLGQRESDTAQLWFDEVRVPLDNLLGQEGQGFAQMMQRLPQERLSSAVANLSQARSALEVTLAYVRERTAFGTAIGSLQHNKFVLAELATQLDVAQAYVDNCVRALVDGELTAVDAAKAKWWSADVENTVLDACVQLFGGSGWTSGNPVGQAWVDARVTRIWAGSNEIMKEIIGRDLGL